MCQVCIQTLVLHGFHLGKKSLLEFVRAQQLVDDVEQNTDDNQENQCNDTTDDERDHVLL